MIEVMPPAHDWRFWADPVDPEQFVYHYTTREAAIGGILPTGQIRFSLYEWMADPRESKTWTFGARQPEGAGDYNLWEITQRINELAKSTTKLFCVSRDTLAIPEPPNERFHRGFAHSRMWTDYAARHSGVCLVFRRQKLHEAIIAAFGGERLRARDVSYYDWTPELQDAFTLNFDDLDTYGVDDALRAHIRTYLQELFFQKNTDWASEVEYRWVLLGDTPTPEFVPFGDALEAICVGENYADLDDPSLHFLAKRFGITNIPRITWGNGRVRVERKLPPGAVSIDAIISDPRTRPLVVDPSQESNPL
jgi:hypothetical protein